MSIKVVTVEIKDPIVSNLHHLRVSTYESVAEKIGVNLPELKDSVVNIAQFSGRVRAKGGIYQDQADSLPAQEVLIEERNTFLAEYHKYKETYEKTTVLATGIANTITFLTPPQRAYSTEQFLKESTPSLYEQTIESERICLDYIASLQKSLTQITSLNTRLLTSINNSDLTWSLQRFCGIVDNNGAPLSLLSRAALNISPYLFTPVIPKPDTNIIGADQEQGEEKPVGKEDPVQTGPENNSTDAAKPEENKDPVQTGPVNNSTDAAKLEENKDPIQTAPENTSVVVADAAANEQQDSSTTTT